MVLEKIIILDFIINFMINFIINFMINFIINFMINFIINFMINFIINFMINFIINLPRLCQYFIFIYNNYYKIMIIIDTLSKKNNSTVALVKINEKILISKYYEQYSRSMFIELNILSGVNHNNIISIELFNEKDHIFMLMEKINYNLSDLLLFEINSSTKYYLLLQIAYAIRHLHYNCIAHLDLKLDNIMFNCDDLNKFNVSNDIECKIIDFGCSEYIFDNYIITNQLKCTITHRAPEVYNGILSLEADIWSFGIIAFEILTKTLIHDYIHINNFKQFIHTNEFEKIRQILPKELQNCLHLNFNERPKIDSIIKILHNLCENINPQIKLNFDANTELKLVTIGNNTRNNFDKYINYVFDDEIYTSCESYILADLLQRLNSFNNIQDTHFDQAIKLLNSIFTSTFDNNFLNKKLITQIILITRGVLIRNNYYCQTLNPNQRDRKLLSSKKYLEKIYHC
ncbi:serine/threonine protein kinase [Cotonvirus japonicus]|uniref:Serine/threonine protein kinase n=1 Tax=Cotonvirus japonicus TaxID=2811091 RepID=A0ABM7NSZ8_9VIRU|nr:serine/threonine protein kinase [Cotonvirus japonicus]BCS83300.1 serine/threonine protein kinase [Cotonvirus japonicus]